MAGPLPARGGGRPSGSALGRPADPASHAPERVEAILALRRIRFTGAQIAEILGMALSTVSGLLSRHGLGRLGRLGLEPARRYERQRPGEVVHIDVKKARGAQTPPEFRRHGAGWKFVHVAIDAAGQVEPDGHAPPGDEVVANLWRGAPGPRDRELTAGFAGCPA